MPKPKAPPFSPLRVISPVMLVFCLILFFLPWIELSCTPPKALYKELSKEQMQELEKKLGRDPTKPYAIVNQSGLQIAIGDVSPSSEVQKQIDKQKKEKVGDGEPQLDLEELKKNKGKSKDGKDEESGVAPLMFLYPVALLGGIIVALVPIPTMPRRIAVAGCCAAAFGVIMLQALIGFPLEVSVKKEIDKQQKEAEKAQKELEKIQKDMEKLQKGAGGAVAKTAEKKEKVDDLFRVSWKFPLYLTLLLLLAAAGLAFVDGDMGGGGRSRYGRKSRRDDYDDYDEDEEDERPRKKRRRDEDDDEDDRPRKKQKALSLDDDDEDDRPKKKRRDEDEDDRPRKKSRRDEEDEEDRPRKRSRRDEDEEEDDRPRKKKPAEPEFQMPAAPPPPPPAAPAAPAGPNPFAFDDEEDDRPKKKPRRRDDDDDEDDRPRKKRRRDDD